MHTKKLHAEEWEKMGRKARLHAMRKTGSWQEDYKTPLKKMGGSQQDAVTQYVSDTHKLRRKAIEAAKSGKPHKKLRLAY
jgi:hypothetical protein